MLNIEFLHDSQAFQMSKIRQQAISNHFIFSIYHCGKHPKFLFDKMALKVSVNHFTPYI